MTAPLRLAVIGLGVISRFYVTALRDSSAMQPVAVCDSDLTRLAAHPVPGYTDHRRMLRETRLDAVVVTVPNDVHAQVCADALEHGVAVCVEKPLALDTAQGTALRKLAEQRDVPLFTAFHRRYNEAVARLRDECAGAPIDEVTVRYFERIEEHAGPDGWYLDMGRCGGGCVADNGPNAFDLVRLLLGPAEVTSAQITRDAGGVDRQADIRLRAGGGRARILLDWSYPGERKDIEVRLADGRTIRADMLAGHPGFKGSLWHEYVEVLHAFERYVRGAGECDGGLAALRFVRDAYRLEDPGRPSDPPAAPARGRGAA
ncbi:Gfo/Idh/MocA family protein [Actinomadura bangladeshensis]|uniref:Gfo/Idh/MocA family oxidoreductase n=1 Tax=Actinomadura bangladeshensis TaxID=453573 RepID=A0A6L9QQ19_9ACTN|nr:Gfo/Idh/MocA family oxidoreductase [Actinomadura bangladeshensis]NEA27112.1 Gfo/Idh/MocA family oxidoreductase [Actinomadura bangladeshensis]